MLKQTYDNPMDAAYDMSMFKLQIEQEKLISYNEFMKSLKACPFCGGQASVQTPIGMNFNQCDYITIGCTNCNASFQDTIIAEKPCWNNSIQNFSDAEFAYKCELQRKIRELAKRWNTRVSDTDQNLDTE